MLIRENINSQILLGALIPITNIDVISTVTKFVSTLNDIFSMSVAKGIIY